jgi:DNA-binding response OmpR family regulator
MGSGKSVVIVEDEPDTAEMFAEMTRLMGYKAMKSHGGVRAIHLIAEVKPDAVILDIMMPDLSGLEVLRYIRRDPRLAKVPVIIVSAKGLPSDIQGGLEAGAAIYLTKPVAFNDLRGALQKVAGLPA